MFKKNSLAHALLILLFTYCFFMPAVFAKTSFGPPINQLLTAVSRDQLSEAETIIRNNPGILLEKATVIDYSNRVFKKITAFQYAVWAYDVPMWNMILNYLSIADAKEQFIDLQTSPRHKNGKNFDFAELLSVMTAFTNVCTSTADEGCGDRWLRVGLAQRKLPAYIANVLTNYEKLNDGFGWFPLSSIGLGYDWAIYHFKKPCDAFSDFERRGPCPTKGLLKTFVLEDITRYYALQQSSFMELNNLKVRLGIP